MQNGMRRCEVCVVDTSVSDPNEIRVTEVWIGEKRSTRRRSVTNQFPRWLKTG
jgi:hypothetical protein